MAKPIKGLELHCPVIQFLIANEPAERRREAGEAEAL